MAVKTSWPIDHLCGHTTTADLSARPADRRAGYARWLAGRNCTDCWKADRDNDTAGKEAWLAAKRAEEQEAADAWAAQYRMPPLEGPERTVGWAGRCRHQLVVGAHAVLVLEGEMDDAGWVAVEETVRTITRAGWWLDQREADPADLPELLQATIDADRPTENPHL
jgi:hypothetical protein